MTFLSALLLGVLASAHCGAMCGGLQSTMQQSMVVRSKRQAIIHLIALNCGRLCVYMLLGFMFGSFGAAIIRHINVPAVSQGARYLAAAILLVLGIQLIFRNARPFQMFERVGASLWQVVSRYRPEDDRNDFFKSYYLGLIWGFLPCGLVYGVLLTTLFSNNGVQGAATLLGFGLGTVPALVLTGTLYSYLRALVRSQYIRFFGGFIFIQGAVLMLFAPLLIDRDFMQAYPELMSTMFCIS